jgi:hypothetical protein
MSDDEQQQPMTQQEGVKSEDANATINIKVRGSLSSDVLSYIESSSRAGRSRTHKGKRFFSRSSEVRSSASSRGLMLAKLGRM